MTSIFFSPANNNIHKIANTALPDKTINFLKSFIEINLRVFLFKV